MSRLSALLAYTKRPQGFLDHAVTQIFYHLHAFTQSDSDFHAKALKLGKNMPLSFTKSRTFLNDFTKSRTFLTLSRITHVSRFTQSHRNKIVFTKSRRKIRSIRQSRNPMGGLLHPVNMNSSGKITDKELSTSSTSPVIVKFHITLFPVWKLWFYSKNCENNQSPRNLVCRKNL